ncbi:MAG TPA: hypothetical protein VG291_03495 [Xanthobacteraceae bacterium]|nr:hypothetical protein [Xanthobacteraceae bacterium]
MRTMIVYFIALLAIPVVQVAMGPRLDRAGVPVVIDRSSQIIIAVSRHLRTPGIEYPLGLWSERRPRAS